VIEGSVRSPRAGSIVVESSTGQVRRCGVDAVRVHAAGVRSHLPLAPDARLLQTAPHVPSGTLNLHSLRGTRDEGLESWVGEGFAAGATPDFPFDADGEGASRTRSWRQAAPYPSRLFVRSSVGREAPSRWALSDEILYVSQYFPPEMGAPSARVHELSREWVRLGHQVTVLTGFPNILSAWCFRVPRADDPARSRGWNPRGPDSHLRRGEQGVLQAGAQLLFVLALRPAPSGRS